MKLKYTSLRQYMQGKDLASPHSLKDCHLIIDGDSFFRDTYKKSGCQFILGPDCDRYANFIKNKLKYFVDNNITCYVIFNGVAKHELEEREEIHQRIIESRNDIKQVLEDAEYFQPLFVKDVQKQVLDEMKIKYFVCQYDLIEAIVGVAKKFKCPVLSNNIEYCLLGASCIQPNSVDYQQNSQPLKCTILEHDKFKTAFGVYGKMPILLTLLNETYLEKLRGIIECNKSHFIPSVVRLVKKQRAEVLVSKLSKSMNDEDRKDFLKDYEKIQTLCLYPSCSLAVKYFQRQKPYGLFRDDKKWFAKGVSNGRIAIPYVDLREDGVICGSRLMYSDKRPDALLAAKDIIIYVHCLLTNSQDSDIKFIGRKRNRSVTVVTEIETYWDREISDRHLFTKHCNGKRLKITGKTDHFKNFLEEILPNFDYSKSLETVPEDCWILIITLVYYISKKNEDFKNGAYCVLLSYIMLGPVSKKLDVLKNYDQSIHSNSEEDCVKVYNGLKFLFERVDFEQKYNSDIVHSLSEFQHCLQHMNYLNKLCGEDIPCTVYHHTYNATFVYNTFLFMKDKNNLMTFINNKFAGSKLLNTYKTIITAFENCISAVNKKVK